MRTHLGVSQAELGAIMSVSLGAASMYERGMREPQVSAIAPLYARGIDLNWLLTGDGKMLRNTSDQAPIAQKSEVTVEPIDTETLVSILSSFVHLVKTKKDYLSSAPVPELASKIVEGYIWLRSMSPEEIAQKAAEKRAELAEEEKKQIAS
ncbi:MAG: hypothetical protein P4L50_29085 [Anaerolineaceae bacterium]|nr:hypothetical protein [Anaerolineaceae bacterium]